MAVGRVAHAVHLYGEGLEAVYATLVVRFDPDKPAGQLAAEAIQHWCREGRTVNPPPGMSRGQHVENMVHAAARHPMRLKHRRAVMAYLRHNGTNYDRLLDETPGPQRAAVRLVLQRRIAEIANEVYPFLQVGPKEAADVVG